MRKLLANIFAKFKSVTGRFVGLKSSGQVLEGAWLRAKPGDTRIGGYQADASGIWLRIPEPDEKTWIHAHPDGIAVPSSTDWLNFQDYFTNNNVRTMHLLGLDESGNLAGRVTVQPTRKFINLAKTDYRAYLETIAGIQTELVWTRKMQIDSVEHGWELLKSLRDRKFARVHVKASPGFEFKEGIFVKKKGLPSRLSRLLRRLLR